MELQDLIYMIVAVLIGAGIVYIFIVWLLPIILPIIIILIIAFLIYSYLKSNNY